MKRLHWPSEDPTIALCGQLHPFVASSTPGVTCKGCKEKLGKKISDALRQSSRLP